MRVRIVGAGRAGLSFARALSAADIEVEVSHRAEGLTEAAAGVDAVLLAVPDAAIAQVTSSIEVGVAVVLHCSGATGLDALAPHPRVGSVHPLMALPDPETGAARLRGGGWFATAGDPLAAELVARLGGRRFEVPDRDRGRYHATAAVAANHLVALLGQVERLAATIGVPVEAFLDLAQGSFDDVRALGASRALTGPAARGDRQTLATHRRALPADELDLYDALARAATELAENR